MRTPTPQKAQLGLEWYKQILEENSSFLLEELSLSSLFFASMVSKKILTYAEVEDLEDEQTLSKRKWKFIKLIQKKSPRNFNGFLEVLKDRGQKYIAAKLTADIKYKSKYNDAERNAQDNINTYIYQHLGQTTHISITEQKKMASELVLQQDYSYMHSQNKELLREIQELEDELKDEKKDHETTKGQLNDMIKQFKYQVDELNKSKEKNEAFKVDLANAATSIKALQNEKNELKEEIEHLMQMEEIGFSVEVSDGDSKKYEEGMSKLNSEIDKLNDIINEQKEHLGELTSKVQGIMTEVHSDDIEELSDGELSPNQCLDKIIEQLDMLKNENAELKEASKPKPSHREKRHQLLSQLEEMTKNMDEKQQQWDKEREESKRREKEMKKNIYNYKNEVSKLKKKVEELNTPSPNVRNRSDSLVSTLGAVPTNSLQLPQVNVYESTFMINGQTKTLKRQPSSETVSSLPLFKRPQMLAPSTLPTIIVGPRGQSLQCGLCNKMINHTELMTNACHYHKVSYDSMRQMWPCCGQPLRQGGCQTGRHQVRK